MSILIFRILGRLLLLGSASARQRLATDLGQGLVKEDAFQQAKTSVLVEDLHERAKLHGLVRRAGCTKLLAGDDISSWSILLLERLEAFKNDVADSFDHSILHLHVLTDLAHPLGHRLLGDAVRAAVFLDPTPEVHERAAVCQQPSGEALQRLCHVHFLVYDSAVDAGERAKAKHTKPICDQHRKLKPKEQRREAPDECLLLQEVERTGLPEADVDAVLVVNSEGAIRSERLLHRSGHPVHVSMD
mmetsp:Transcript_725/g.1950  ORF Transcript_725/g.1950 Transcript_725/m.1950 type:complete len:245 (+) Transcript_725:344-1078(+)